MMTKKDWTIEIGSGVIDCCSNRGGDVVIAGDITGKFILCNCDGKILLENKVELPIWGVDFSTQLDVVAIGTASKSPLKGELIVFKQNEIIFKHSLSSPVWDVKIIENLQLVVASTWKDGLIIYSLLSQTFTSYSFEESLFGLAYEGSNLYIVASEKGVYKFDLDSQEPPILIYDERTCCYNIYHNEIERVLYVGSNSNTLSKIDLVNTKNSKTYITLSRQISAISHFGENIITGDLSGNLYVNKINDFLAPIYYQKLEDAIWNLQFISDSKKLLIANGNGFLECYSLSESEYSYWNFESLPFDEKHLKGIKIFINYAKEDKDSVLKLYTALHTIGCTPWMDEFNILPGQNWKYETTKAIEEADFILICLSSFSVAKKGYVQKEIKIALDIIDLLPQNKVFIIPIKLDECNVPDNLKDWQAVDLFAPNGFQKFVYSIFIDRIKYQSILNKRLLN